MTRVKLEDDMDEMGLDEELASLLDTIHALAQTAHKANHHEVLSLEDCPRFICQLRRAALRHWEDGEQ